VVTVGHYIVYWYCLCVSCSGVYDYCALYRRTYRTGNATIPETQRTMLLEYRRVYCYDIVILKVKVYLPITVRRIELYNNRFSFNGSRLRIRPDNKGRCLI
jgi:hypothetical protein